MLKRLPPVFRKRILPALALAAVAAMLSHGALQSQRTEYLTVNPSVTQRFVAVPSETSLADLCYRLSRVQGVTGVSYRDFDAAAHSARVTVFFNPRQTSVRQLKIFMLHTKILWTQEMNA